MASDPLGAPISELNAASTLTGAEIVPLTQTTVTRRTTLQLIADWIIQTAASFVQQSGSGAVATTAQEKIRNAVPVDAKSDFGAVGDGVTDDTAALQAAIDYCITYQRKLLIPLGVYSISSPLLIAKFSGTAYTGVSLEIEGEKLAYVHSTVSEGTLQRSSLIVPTFVDTFAIGLQNSRAVRIKDVALYGMNDISITAGASEIMTNANFVTGSCRDSRYSPYAGICIDPFGTSAPADGGYPGFSSYYVASAAGSSRVVLDGVVIKNFVVGVMITPNDTTQNAEDISFRDCRIGYNKVGVAIGQSQSRDVQWYGGNCAWNLYCFDGNSYGAQTGGAPKIYGCNMSGKYLFNIYNRGGDSMFASGLHAESFASIGFLGGPAASASEGHKFVGCSFTLWDGGTGIFPDHHLVAQGSVNFDSCTFMTTSLTYGTPMRFYHRAGAPISFNNCEFYREQQNEFWLAPTLGVGSVEWDQLYFSSCIFSDAGTRGNSTGHCDLSHMNVKFSLANIDRVIAVNGAIYRIHAGTATDLNFVGGTLNSVSLGSLTVTTGANGTAAFTVADGTIVNTGDLIYTTTVLSVEKYDGLTFSTASICLGIVTSVSGNDITISGWPQSLVTGPFALTKKWWSRLHQASVGDTHTNTTIDNVTNFSTWKDGNAIKGSGIPAGAYIVSGGGTATLTISKATTSTLTGTRLYDADLYKITGTAV